MTSYPSNQRKDPHVDDRNINFNWQVPVQYQGTAQHPDSLRPRGWTHKELAAARAAQPVTGPIFNLSSWQRWQYYTQVPAYPPAPRPQEPPAPIPVSRDEAQRLVLAATQVSPLARQIVEKFRHRLADHPGAVVKLGEIVDQHLQNRLPLHEIETLIGDSIRGA